MTIKFIVWTALASPLIYLAWRWGRSQLTTWQLKKLSHHWSNLEKTWDHLSKLPLGAHTETMRQTFAVLQRERLHSLQKMGPQHARIATHAKLISQYLRGSYTPPKPRVALRAAPRLAAVAALRQSLASSLAKDRLPGGLIIRCDAELNQWLARLELDNFTATAMRDALLGRKRQALTGLQQAMGCLPRLPVADAKMWRNKLQAEQKRLRGSLSGQSSGRATTA